MKTAVSRADAYAEIPRGLLSFFKPSMYCGETHNCYQGARKISADKIAKFIISKGPATAAEYLEELRKLLAAKEAEKAKQLQKAVTATAPKLKKRRRKDPTELIRKAYGVGSRSARSASGGYFGD